jgi:uncharacterized protein YkwD
MRLLPILLAVLALGTAVLPAGASAATGAGRTGLVLDLLNRERAAHGLPQLRADPRLARAARAHSADMVRRHYFDHASPEGEHSVGRVRRTGWLEGRRHWSIGENLAWGIGKRGTPAATVRAWMRSPAHHRVVLGRMYRHVGIGVAVGTPSDRTRGVTYTADFGS